MSTTKFVKDVQPKILFDQMTEEEIRWAIDRTNPENPFHKYVGNDEVVNKVLRLAYTALGRADHNASDIRLAFLGGAGLGKTAVANMFAELLDLPFAKANPSGLNTVHDLFLEIAKACASVGFEHADGRISTLALRPQSDDFHFIAPPMIVFIDEAHLLKKEIEQALLTATDDTHELVTNKGVHLDTRNICWIVATTESGDLFHALKTRFSRAQFRPYNPSQMAKIVQANTSLPFDVCERIVFFSGRVTREAIDFSKEVVMEKKKSGSTYFEAIEVIRKEHRIDDLGMEDRRLSVLKAIGQKGPLSQAKCAAIARCQIEELRTEVMPPLTDFPDDEGESLVVVSSRGYQITEAGKAELAKRCIVATAKSA